MALKSNQVGRQPWHRRYAHTSTQVIRQPAATSLHLFEPREKLTLCLPFLVWKKARKAFRSHFSSTRLCVEVTLSDVSGALPAGTYVTKVLLLLWPVYEHKYLARITQNNETHRIFDAYRFLPEAVKYFNRGIAELYTDGCLNNSSMDFTLKSKTLPKTLQYNSSV